MSDFSQIEEISPFICRIFLALENHVKLWGFLGEIQKIFKNLFNNFLTEVEIMIIKWLNQPSFKYIYFVIFDNK